jgi:membrane protease YdiL (CAAX protease family)
MSDKISHSIRASQQPLPSPSESLVRRHPIAAYFGLTFLFSWAGALLVAAPHLLNREPLPKLTGILMFPAMLLGPSAIGIALTWLLDGSAGMRELFSSMRRIRFSLRWYAALLIPPAMILAILLSLKALVSPVYSPNRFLVGLAFGIPAGFFEEIGWMGFAFPKMRQKLSGLSAAVLLGFLWGLWHLPIIDFLGTATPHGAYWLPFFAAFATTMTAMRVLIAWLYSNTGSVLLCQLMHTCSTGSLVIFSPPRVSAAQEALWYAAYAAALWLLVALLSRRVITLPCPGKSPRVG